MIIDYHAHLKWDRETNSYDTEACLKDMEENCIEKRMVSALYGYSVREQNEAVERMVREHPDQIIGCAVINPKERDCVEEMERVASCGCFKAIELDSMEHCYYPETMPVLAGDAERCRPSGPTTPGGIPICGWSFCIWEPRILDMAAWIWYGSMTT